MPKLLLVTRSRDEYHRQAGLWAPKCAPTEAGSSPPILKGRPEEFVTHLSRSR